MGISTLRVNVYCVFFVAMFMVMLSVPAVASVLVSTGLNGSLGYDYRMISHSTGASENQAALRANMSNRFFIWQDWFIKGRSNLTFVQQDTVNSQGSGATQSVSGSVGLDVLSQSKVPFSFNYGLYDSSNSPAVKAIADSGALSDDHVVGQTMFVSQSYVGDKFRLDLIHTNDTYDSSNKGVYGSNSLDLKGIWRSSGGDLRAVASQKESTTYDGVERETSLISLNHGYTGLRQFTFSTVASSSKIDQVTLNASTGASYNYTMSMDQVNSLVTWRSQSEKTSVTSNIRYSGMTLLVVQPPQDNKMSSLSTSLGVVHRFTKNLNVNVRLSRLQSTTEVSQNETARDRVGINYRSDRISLGKVFYDWRTGASYSQLKDTDKTQDDSSVTLGQAMSRSWSLSGKQRVSLQAGQDFSVNVINSSTDLSETYQRLGHRATLSWNQLLGPERRQAQLIFSDRRNFSDSSSMQTMGIDLSQQKNISHRIKLGGKLNYQMTNYQHTQVAGGSTASSTSSSTINFNLSYLNPFSIAGLVFNSDYRFSQSVVDQSDDLTSQQVWNNKLVYRVGKLDTSLQYMYREARQVSYNMVYFNVKRVF
ncbi:MAG: hypothetical protein ISEC1_P1712 [Thiomicrorhabdus sp.]|nr:MAG: hypothetical protein ISEC1_P1712 [Thiomicrorhabdus sp.]